LGSHTFCGYAAEKEARCIYLLLYVSLLALGDPIKDYAGATLEVGTSSAFTLELKETINTPFRYLK
jgi:hypothetical protein